MAPIGRFDVEYLTKMPLQMETCQQCVYNMPRRSIASPIVTEESIAL